MIHDFRAHQRNKYRRARHLIPLRTVAMNTLGLALVFVFVAVVLSDHPGCDPVQAEVEVAAEAQQQWDQSDKTGVITHIVQRLIEEKEKLCDTQLEALRAMYGIAARAGKQVYG